MSTKLTPDRIRELIAREDATLARVVSFISEGVAAGRIDSLHGQLMIRSAEWNRDSSVKLLRALLGEDNDGQD